MRAKILDGAKLANKIKEELKDKVIKLKQTGNTPGLAVILVGDDFASSIYVNLKKKACKEIGINSFEFLLDKSTSEKELISLVQKLNQDPKINGILVQSPLPSHIDEKNVIFAINPKKDVDCFHPVNVGKLMSGFPEILPCTPAGILRILQENEIQIEGKECVVVGRSNIVGKPTAMLLLSKNGTVTLCHSKTSDLKEVCKRADILVVAAGNPEFINKEFVKPGAVVIDVGMNRIGPKKVVGDVDFNDVSDVASAITPVPKGVGPMTIIMLMENTLKAFQSQISGELYDK